MTFLCDTNIISELSRPTPNQGVIAWSGTVTSIHLSVITLEEIYYGLAATTEIHNLTLVTRNTKDFEGCGISILNPFT